MSEKKTVLIVEDNEQLNRINGRALARAGYGVLTAYNLEQARALMSESEPDVIILDVMLPDGDGVEFCREIREHTAASILFLTALGGYNQTLEGLAAGGDDYLTKPFDLELLVAKVASFLRRDEIADRFRQPENHITIGPITLDTSAAQALLGGDDMALSQKEYALLLLFAQNPGKVLSAKEIYESVWRQPFVKNDTALKSMISRLRRSLEGSGYEIISVRGVGYRLEKE